MDFDFFIITIIFNPSIYQTCQKYVRDPFCFIKLIGFRLFLYCLNTSNLILVLEVSNGAHTVSKISKGVVLSLHIHQNFLFNKVDLKFPIVSTKDPLFLGFYIDYTTSGETPASLFPFCQMLVWATLDWESKTVNKTSLRVISTHFWGEQPWQVVGEF